MVCSFFALSLALCGALVAGVPFQYVLYFLPFLALLGFVAGAANGSHEIGRLSVGIVLSLLLALVIASRLLLFPLGWPALSDNKAQPRLKLEIKMCSR
jgi:hypothetical protein